jgi:Protein of unknown function (DUF3137)
VSGGGSHIVTIHGRRERFAFALHAYGVAVSISALAWGQMPVSDAFDDAKIMPDAAARARSVKAVAEYNAERPRSQMAVYRNIGLVIVPGALLYGWVAWLLLTSGGGKNSPQSFILAGMIMGLLWGGQKLWSWVWQPATDLQQAARDELIPHVFSFVENLRYRHGLEPAFMRGLPAKSIVQYSRIQYDDMITGVHDGLAFSLCECMFWLHQGKSESVTFQGAIFHCKAPQNFPGLLVVSENLSGSSRFWFGGPDDRHIPEIHMDESRIKRLYSVRSTNPVAAKALLDGNLGRTLIWLHGAWQDAVPRLVLSKDDIFLLVPSNKNFFELPPIGTDVDYVAHLEPMVREMAMLLATGSLVRKAVLLETNVGKAGINES